MSRELKIEQKALILSEVERNKSRGYENPYEITTDTYSKCMELNDHETYRENVKYYLNELKEENHKKTYMAKEFGYYHIDKGN